MAKPKIIGHFSNSANTKEVCATAVVFYKNLFLLLFDRKHRYYVLPQGHREIGESLGQTSLREITEETGYQRLILQNKLGSHSYTYVKSGRVVRKIIHVYLVQLLDITRSKYKKSPKEHYRNYWMTYEKAVKKVRWERDKTFLTLGKTSLSKIA